MERPRDFLTMKAMSGLKFSPWNVLLANSLVGGEGLVARLGKTSLAKTDLGKYEVEAHGHIVVWCLLLCSLPPR